MSVSCFLVFSWLLQRIILRKESMRKVPNINQYENLTYKRLTLSQCCKHHWSSLQPIHKIYSKLYHFEFLESQLVFHDIHINFVKNIIRVFFYYQFFLYSWVLLTGAAQHPLTWYKITTKYACFMGSRKKLTMC